MKPQQETNIGQADLLIDVSRLIWRLSRGRLPTGIDRVCLAYVAHFRDRAQAVIQWKNVRRILSPDLSARLFDLILAEGPNFRAKVVRLGLQSLPRVARSQPGYNRLYLNIGHSGLDRPGLTEWVKQANVRAIFMVHDLIPITHPEYCRAGGAEKHEKRVNAMLRSGTGIIGNSQATLDVMKDYASQRGIDTPSMLPAWLGATPLPSSDTGLLQVAKPFFVTLGTIEGRKNHLMLLNMWQEMISVRGTAAPRLVIIGQRGWESEQALNLLDSSEILREHVVELPRCTDAELVHYLRDAQALLFPSFAEGYGMPLVEALGVGTPVIASNLCVFKELAGDIPDYVEPTNQDEWRAAVEEYANSGSDMRAAQLDRMAHYKMPTWSAHFAAVDNWLDSLQAD